jgi:anaerobic ribonucleoside-triphosphate reductase activating protein
MTFTGFTYGRLIEEDRPGWRDLLQVTDLLVDGPFLRDRPDLIRPWVGSTNQRFICLTDRYSALCATGTPHSTLEIRLRPDGTVFVNGMADRRELKSVRHLVSRSSGQLPNAAGNGRGVMEEGRWDATG